jgi:hypothetical protein
MAHRKSLIQVKFRFREDLLRRLEREAKRNDRSTNAEIAHRLEQSLQKEDEAAHMSRIASMAAEKFSADVEEKLYGKVLRSFGVEPGEGGKWSPERAMLAAGLMMGQGMARRWLQELSEQDPQKTPTTAPERPEHRKEGN